MVGELSPKRNTCSEDVGDDGDNENMNWKGSEACMEGHLVCGD